MKKFVDLFNHLDSTTSLNEKTEFLRQYFEETQSTATGAWGLFFLTGQRLKRLVPAAVLRAAFAEARPDLKTWLFEECYSAVGDLAETFALLLNEGFASPIASFFSLDEMMEQKILPLREMEKEAQISHLQEIWKASSADEIFILNKLLTGNFRVGVSEKLVYRALSEVFTLPVATIAERMFGDWKPSIEIWKRFGADFREEHHEDVEGVIPPSRPFPFFLASPLEKTFEELGQIEEYFVEWKWDGIRGQLVRRKTETGSDRVSLWSRGEELVTEVFPELIQGILNTSFEGVLDGEILVARGGKPAPFADLQKRLGRKKVTAKFMTEYPAEFWIYDLLEYCGEDLRNLPMSERRQRLEAVIKDLREQNPESPFRISPMLEAESWEAVSKFRSQSRLQEAEGVMLKLKNSVYESGRKRGAWWKWKVDPLTVDAVLLYAQAGHGRRANLFTDYTFAIWKDKELVPFAKAYSGLTDKEIVELDRWIRTHTKERFGPVRSVTPHHVFELGFEGIQKSTRHRSSFAVRFPRILRWRKDKPYQEADTIECLEQLLENKNLA